MGPLLFLLLLRLFGGGSLESAQCLLGNEVVFCRNSSLKRLSIPAVVVTNAKITHVTYSQQQSNNKSNNTHLTDLPLETKTALSQHLAQPGSTEVSYD